jgi:acyl-CoA thioesterase
MGNEGEAMKARSTGPHRFEMDGWISCAPFERLLHMEIVKAADGQAILRMPFLIDYAQGGGLMHGGALVSLADTAVVMAIKSLIPPQSHFATILCETKFLLPVKKGIVTAKAKVVDRQGRTLKGRATVYDEEERAVMEFSSTFKIARDTTIKGIIFKDI